MNALRAFQSRNNDRATFPGNQIFSPGPWEPVGNTLRGLRAKIQANGDLVYRLPSGQKGEFIDKGRRLLIGDKFTDEKLEASLKLAAAKFGSTLHLAGSEDFKKAIIRLAEEKKLKIKFADQPRNPRDAVVVY